MRMFAALTAFLVGAGVVLALYVRMPFSTGVWLTGAVLIVFALLGRRFAARESTGSHLG
jgi:Na+(H+)/acetate symporter ActP